MTDTKNITPSDHAAESEKIILNSKPADSGSKIIFDDNILYSQFLRDYIDLPYMKDVRPEDIEDVSDQYVPLFAEERNADRVKKVNIKNEKPFFLVSLIEHKSKIDYNVSMQIFRYMVYIWEAYAKEAEKMQKGITKRADFKYPPILPTEQVQSILEETPEHLLNIISDILRTFLLRMRFSEAETENLVGKVKEKKMGILFENVKPFDIEEERRKTAEERRKTEATKEKGIQALIETCQELGASKEDTMQKLPDKFALNTSEASEKMDLYWKS